MNADLLRGHAFLPDPATLASIPALYATEDTPLDDELLHLHYFAGSCDWWVAELNADHRRAFGYADLGHAEWGYFDLAELRAVAVRHPSGLPVVVERDLHWTPIRFADLRRQR
jgi:hypothetical protein